MEMALGENGIEIIETNAEKLARLEKENAALKNEVSYYKEELGQALDLCLQLRELWLGEGLDSEVLEAIIAKHTKKYKRLQIKTWDKDRYFEFIAKTDTQGLLEAFKKICRIVAAAYHSSSLLSNEDGKYTALTDRAIDTIDQVCSVIKKLQWGK